MRCVVQRVRSASVTVEEKIVSSIGPGLLLLLGVSPDDADSDVTWLAGKISALRIFDDSDKKPNKSITDIGGEILVVSQFTLLASIAKGNRPSYTGAARPEIAIPMYELFIETLQGLLGKPVASGIFGADMLVELQNDGPITILMDSRNRV